ncbi:3440_t:CDS:2 [Entrophospora sp. SA101]|nr:3440_t:CDS:2 [Entrophospora sp. SA101]CAJ0857721.1 10184_t:CDS:2 [Entrophospora sp. SA101]CAJ0917420.1 14288_t:CDS:2 [Entrophospora sp. SA101]CAJ0922991.1 13891_t:CDS:2 [Entrophospora sp. SA101]
MEGDEGEQVAPNFNKEGWYTDALDYWSSTPATINGMLGGFGVVSQLETNSSIEFIKEFIEGRKGARNVIKVPPYITKSYALDCGAGIGRVTKHFLLKVFEKVDLVEYTPKFIKQAESQYLLNEKKSGKIGKFICKGLQEFTPETKKYDMIWCQWVLSHLTDEDLIQFFKRCKIGLKNNNGIIGIKENINAIGYCLDKDDSSVTRSDKIFKEIFEKSGLKLIKEAVQFGMPEGLFEVKM